MCVTAGNHVEFLEDWVPTHRLTSTRVGEFIVTTKFCNYFASSDPHHGIQFIHPDIQTAKSSGILFGILFEILSGISSGILSGRSSHILSGILSGRSSDILSGISSDILSGISSDILSWHIF